MKRIMVFISSSMAEFIGLILLLILYGLVTQLGSFFTDQEIYLLEFANRIFNDNFFKSEFGNHYSVIPVSPLLTLMVSLIFKIFSTKIFCIKVVMLAISFLSLLVFYILGARLFHGGVASISTLFLIATWGFFSNSSSLNGAMIYFFLVLTSLLLFFHWFDSAFRSKTYAKSLCYHFLALGLFLGLSFCTYGISGILFPVLVMLLTLLLSRKEMLLKEIRYPWLVVPFFVVLLIWIISGIFLFGYPVNFLSSLVRFNPSFSHVWEPFAYLLPLAIFLIPALMTKDIWVRAIVSYQKILYLLAAWAFCGFIFLVLFPDFHQAFSLLIVAPAIIWLGFYLGEIFRNPLIPFSIQLVMDSMALIGLILSVCFIVLTFQIIPPYMQGRFIILSFALPMISLVLLFLRDFTISRILPLYVVPSALVLCILAQATVMPVVRFKPAQELYPLISSYDMKLSHTRILEWIPDKTANSTVSNIDFAVRDKVVPVSNRTELESMIQTRQGILYLILPEKVFYNLPFTVRDMGSIAGVSWQWKKPLTFSVCFKALKNEMLDFDALSEPVLLFKISELPYP